MSFPGEHEESIRLAREIGGDLRPCADAATVAQTLSILWGDWIAGRKSTRAAEVDVSRLSWDCMARQLEVFFTERLDALGHAAA
jgi:hypothetical protein